MQWDLFCRVVDNFGDIGVCWRLAADLAARGEAVRLRVDDSSALAWMAPGGVPGVEVLRWPADAAITEAPGDVVVEAFGCDPPQAFVAAMAARRPAPVWINLEYLSAEAAVERNHRLASPQMNGAGRGLVKRFFYPGFTPGTGGLLREADLVDRQRAFYGPAWLAARGLVRHTGESVVSLFCYANPALPSLLEALASRPTLLLVAPGAAAAQVRSALGPTRRRGSLRAELLPWLDQREFDHLLWASDLNFVRGEDSFVRAQWAARPFVWQIYPQADGVHHVKLDAFLERHLAGADASLASEVRRTWAAWNGIGAASFDLSPNQAWCDLAIDWRYTLLAQADLTTQLIGYAHETR
jgi:uncharacterized repeat protein (TIGR03837 family)